MLSVSWPPLISLTVGNIPFNLDVSFFILPLISFQFNFSLFFFIFLRLFSLCFHNDPLDGPPDRYYENDQQNGFLNDGSSDVDGSGWENNSNDGGVSIPITQHPSWVQCIFVAKCLTRHFHCVVAIVCKWFCWTPCVSSLTIKVNAIIWLEHCYVWKWTWIVWHFRNLTPLWMPTPTYLNINCT